MRSFLFAISLLASYTEAQRSSRGVASNKKWVVDNKYTFDSRSYYDFSKINVAGGTTLKTKVPAGLKASDYNVDEYTYKPSNVAINGGYLLLKVNANSFTSGEVTTTSKMRYASVRTVAILSDPAGTCNGMFFYQSDTQETDIEFLSNAKSASNVDAAQANGDRAGTRYLWLSNQASSASSQKVTTPVPLPANPTSTEHEYRLDWLPGMTRFFVDGVQVWNSTVNVPRNPGVWVFNNWANSDGYWAAGPPSRDSIFRIKEIDMYYNAA
ncbi:Beta-glucanase [Colletotrichum spinosum]|uniref:Beta-glucanase n=1 Tax=Colletotrichum spinosum TaxID=1347390 RepID=A0A4R8Q5C4_9PEZI|nr:Beta-glucanase [Colletotrichum spinosum]